MHCYSRLPPQAFSLEKSADGKRTRSEKCRELPGGRNQMLGPMALLIPLLV